MNGHWHKRRWLPLVFCGALLPFGVDVPSAASLDCSFSMSTPIDFGTINILTGRDENTSGTLDITCTGTPFQKVTICPNIGTGNGNTSTFDPRQMKKWGNNALKLNFNIFWPSGDAIWGTLLQTGAPPPPIFHLQLDATGNGSAQYTVPVTIFGGQYTTQPGVYYSNFGRNHVLFQYKSGQNSDCTNPDGEAKPRFRVRVRVDEVCEVSATDMDFGAVGNLNANVDSTATITVRCTNGTPYKIRIDGGQAGRLNPARREMRNGGNVITYGIYRDAARTQGWGRRNNNDVDATGTGYVQTYTAYGRVPAQATPPPGTYTDTLVVTVRY